MTTAFTGLALPSGRVSPALPSYSSPLSATSYLRTSPSYPTISLPDAVPPRDSSRVRDSVSLQADTAPTSLARMQLQQMQDEARRLGLNEKSAGWLILEALQAATEGEWAAVAELLANGDATLLLPRDPPSVFTSSSQLSASFAYDHTIFNAASASSTKPSPSAVPSSATCPDALSILTLSGLRGSLSRAPSDQSEPDTLVQAVESQQFQLILQSFVVKTSQSAISNLKDASSRQETLEMLAPLPIITSLDKSNCRYPSFSLLASNAQFPLPPPLNVRKASSQSQAGGKNRARSNSKLNAAGSRASASFASIFGGSGRERRRQAEAAGTTGSEMLDAQRLSVNATHLDVQPFQGANVAQDGLEIESGAQIPSSLGVELRGDLQHTTNDEATSIKESTCATTQRRSVSVWVVDHLVRRSTVMKMIRKALDTRIKERLLAKSIPESISDVVASFAATYLPPAPSLNDVSASRSGGAERGQASHSNRSRAASPVNVVNPPYLADPDELSENFQDFFNSIREQLYNFDSSQAEYLRADSDTAAAIARNPAPNASLEEQHAQHDRIERQLEAVETVLCEEVYDRIFCPVTSRDRYHDDALASRIAALNVLGLSLRHLGLVVPSERLQEDEIEATESNALLDGIERIVQQCGDELQRLESAMCRSPQAKLDVLVRAHKIAVEGVAQLPSIKMRDDDTAVEGQEKEQTARPSSGKKGDGSTSADLILPILIYSIVSSNPSHLASNLLYIQRFRAESLVQGETSYCLVNVQAAVAFLENVDVKDLGLDSNQIGAHLRVHSRDEGHAPRSSTGSSHSLVPSSKIAETSSATLAMPARIRGRLTQEIGDLAGASNKVITGVMGSSISAFSRMMGANASVAEAGVDESLGRKRAKSSASLNAAHSEGAVAPTQADAQRPLRSRTSSSVTPTDDSYLGEQSKEKEKDTVGTPSTDKPSIGDRLAMLSRLGTSALSSSPSSSLGSGLPSDSGLGVSASGQSLIASPRAVSRELPGPPPPTKTKTTRPVQNRTTSYLASQLSRTTATPPRTSSGSLSAVLADEVVAAAKPLPASLRSPYAPLSRPPTCDRPLHIVLASTGSVASVKIPLIVQELLTYANVRVQVIATDNSLHFYDRADIAKLNAASGGDGDEYTVASLAAENQSASVCGRAASHVRAHLWTNADEWTSFSRIGDPILHIELRRWADMVLIAPCSANTLAKIYGGMCDDLLTSFVRALARDTPKWMFPAMNTLMWENEVTEVHVDALRRRGWVVHGPVEKMLACGDMGTGAMVEWTELVQTLVQWAHLVRDESR